MRFRVYTWACLNVEPETTLVVFEGENYACGWNGLISSAIHSTPPPKALWRHLLLGNLARDEISPEGAGVVAFCSRSNMFQSDQDPWECRFLHFYGHLWPIPSWKNDQWQMWQPFLGRSTKLAWASTSSWSMPGGYVRRNCSLWHKQWRRSARQMCGKGWLRRASGEDPDIFGYGHESEIANYNW